MGGLGDTAFRIEVNTKRPGYFAYNFLVLLCHFSIPAIFLAL